jgi:hypothetical protein
MKCCHCNGCDHPPDQKHGICLSCAALRKAPLLFVLLFACSVHASPVAAPASQPSTQPASAPIVNPPEGIFTPLDPSKPNGDQRITRAGMEILAAHIVRERAAADKKIATANARAEVADEQRDVSDANAAQSAWKATWMPIITGVLGAAAAAGIETFVVWGLNDLKTQKR